MKHNIASVVLVAVLSGVPPVLHAGEEPPSTPLVEAAPVPADDWEFSFSPYLWTAGLEGVTGVGEFVAPVDVDFGDIWDNLDLAFLAAAEARKGRWGFMTNLTWMKLSSDKGSGGILYDSVDVELTQTILDARLAYRALEGRTSLDLMAGARYMAIDTDIDFRGGRFDQSDVAADKDWIDPLVGARLTHQFNDKWLGVLRGDIGGFGVSSDLVWEAFGGLGYRITDSATLFAGYRHLDVDYDRNFIFDAEMSGAVIGCQFSF